MPMSPEGLHPASWLVAAGRPSEAGAPLNVPLVPASTFLLGDRLEYSRDDGTPTWEALEEVVGGLEGGRAVAFASGMAAIAAVFDQMPAGARVVLPDDCYQGVAGLAEAGRRAGRWSVERLAGDDTARWIAACASADLIWLESPSNPLLTVSDVSAICAADRKPGAILAVDNTFATPLNQRPLDHGATVSIQSATKFIGGHSDLLAGVATTRDDRAIEALRTHRELAGATPGTLETFLAVRGARTMALRLERAQANAASLVERLTCASIRPARALSGIALAPDTRHRAPQSQGIRHDHLVRYRWWRGGGRRRVPERPPHPSRHESWGGRVHDRAPRQSAGPGTSAPLAAAAQCRRRTRRGSLGRPAGRPWLWRPLSDSRPRSWSRRPQP